jgi:hypothetical protein
MGVRHAVAAILRTGLLICFLATFCVSDFANLVFLLLLQSLSLSSHSLARGPCSVQCAHTPKKPCLIVTCGKVIPQIKGFPPMGCQFQDVKYLFFGIFRKYCCIWKEWDVVVNPAHRGNKRFGSHFVRLPRVLAHLLLLCLESAIGKDLVSYSNKGVVDVSFLHTFIDTIRDLSFGSVRLSSMAASYNVRLSSLSRATAVFDMSVRAMIVF